MYDHLVRTQGKCDDDFDETPCDVGIDVAHHNIGVPTLEEFLYWFRTAARLET